MSERVMPAADNRLLIAELIAIGRELSEIRVSSASWTPVEQVATPSAEGFRETVVSAPASLLERSDPFGHGTNRAKPLGLGVFRQLLPLALVALLALSLGLPIALSFL